MFKLVDFNTGSIFACMIFGAIGFVAFMYGKKKALFRSMALGIALMAFPYFVSSALATYLIGITLTIVVFIWRE